MLSKRAVLIRVDEVVGKVFGESLGNGVGRHQLRKKGKKRMWHPEIESGSSRNAETPQREVLTTILVPLRCKRI
jgi:hypothetical protein